jgi:FixJ family two-component response regulator
VSSAVPKVFVIDDDESVARALERLLTSAGFHVSAFTSGRAFLDHGMYPGPACLILDQRMPDLSGLQLQKVIAAAGGSMSVVFLTGYGDVPTTVEAMKGGAVDVLVKPVDETRLLTVVRRALDDSIATSVAQHEREAFLARLARLTPREQEVAALVVQGRLNREIAVELGTAEKTIKVHRARVMRKLDVRSVAELARIAERTNTLRPRRRSSDEPQS